MALAAIATRQHGVLTTAQLLEAGLSASAIRRRVEAGALHPLHRGVYAVGHVALPLDGRQLAAVLATGTGAGLGFRSAGRLWDLIRYSGVIEVAAPRSRDKRSGFMIRRSRCLSPADLTTRKGIPVTTVARTLVDLAEVLNERRLAKAIAQAEVQGRFDLHAVHAALARVPGRAGRHRLLRVLATYSAAPVTRSANEARFLDICEAQGIPPPQSNMSRAGYELDFLWPGHGVAVEMDDPAIHYTIHAYHEDRRRDRVLARHGIHVIRVTPQDLEDERALAQELGDILTVKAPRARA